MDITIQMRSIDLLIKMLKKDTEGIPQYGYARQKHPYEIQPIAQPLPRCTPEEAGISSAVAEQLFRTVEKDGVVVADKNGMEFKIDADSVILSAGYKPLPLEHNPKDKHIHVIGDANKVGNLRTVIWGAWDVAMKL